MNLYKLDILHDRLNIVYSDFAFGIFIALTAGFQRSDKKSSAAAGIKLQTDTIVNKTSAVRRWIKR